MGLIFAFTLMTVLASGLASGPVVAQNKRNAADRAEVERRLEASREALEKSRQREKQVLELKEKRSKERARLTQQLLDVSQKTKEIEGRLTELEFELENLESKERHERGKLASQHRSIGTLLGAMQRMGRNPPPVIITQRNDALRMVRSAMLLARAYPKFKGEADKITKVLKDLAQILADKREKRARWKLEAKRNEEARIRIAALQAEKNRTILAHNKELKAIGKAKRIYGRRVNNDLDLMREHEKAVIENTGLGIYEEKLARARLQSQGKGEIEIGGKAKVEPKKRTRVAAITPSAIELTPSGGGLKANPGRLEPAIPFAKARARLPLPAQGKQVIRFGDETSRGGRSKGLVIKTRHGAQITSPCDGWVVYAGAFRSYGQLLIINAGGGYHVLLANLSRIDVQLGQFVLAAEPVGSMARAGRRGKTDAPVLYVEFRKNSKPIDPSPWWAAGQRRVQG